MTLAAVKYRTPDAPPVLLFPSPTPHFHISLPWHSFHPFFLPSLSSSSIRHSFKLHPPQPRHNHDGAKRGQEEPAWAPAPAGTVLPYSSPFFFRFSAATTPYALFQERPPPRSYRVIPSEHDHLGSSSPLTDLDNHQELDSPHHTQCPHAPYFNCNLRDKRATRYSAQLGTSRSRIFRWIKPKWPRMKTHPTIAATLTPMTWVTTTILPLPLSISSRLHLFCQTGPTQPSIQEGTNKTAPRAANPAAASQLKLFLDLAKKS